MFTGRDIFDQDIQPNSQYQKIFKAQLIKDYAMANKVKELLEKDKSKKDKFLVIAGSGHMSHYTGVYEILFNNTNSITKEEAAMIICRPNDNIVDNTMEYKELYESIEENLIGIVKSETLTGSSYTYPGDFLFLFNAQEADSINSQEKCEESVRKETADAYNQVGQAAHIKGNTK